MEGGSDEGASVGEDTSEPSGSIEGSKSRSGMGGERSGRRVIRRSTSRRNALDSRLFHSRSLSGYGLLGNFNEHDAAPSRFRGHLPPQTHLDQKLHELDELECTSCPFVVGVPLAPSSSIFGMQRRRNERLQLGIGLDYLRK